MGQLEELQREFDRINDIIKEQRTQINRFRNDKATQTALQQRLATLQAWMNQQGYVIDISYAVENNFNEFEYQHTKDIKRLQDMIEALSGHRPIIGE